MLPDEKEILLRLSRGDSAAFDKIYLHYVPHVESFAFCMLKSKSEAEDLAHDIFLKIWENRSMLPGINSFKDYLFRMTKNAIFNLYERKQVRNRYRDDVLSSDCDFLPEEITRTIDSRDLLLLIRIAVENMPSPRREIFRMSRCEGFTQREIAEKLNISQKNVEYHIHEALTELRKIVHILLFFIG